MRVMKKRFAITFILSLIIVFNSCNSSLTGPALTSDQINLLKNPSFELNGKPTLEGWETTIASPGFSNDTPNKLSNWSVYIRTFNPFSLSTIPLTELYQKVKLQSGAYIYTFSCWVKMDSAENGRADLIEYKSDNSRKMKSVKISNAFWANYSVTDTISSNAIDSVQVNIFGGYETGSNSKMLVNFCSLTAR